MLKDKKIEKIKEKIKVKREELNKIVLKEIGKDEVLKFSQELDLLIGEYSSYIAKGMKNSR